MFELLLPRKRMAAVVEGLARQFAAERDLALRENDLFEAFAAYCIVRQYQRDFDPIDVRAGGPCDLGIDAYAVMIDGDIYTDPTEIRERIADDRDIDVRFVIIQAKRQVGFDGDALAKLAEGITQIFSPADLSVRAGKSARRLRECVRAIYADLDKFEASGPPRLEAWYASLGAVKPGLLRDKREAALKRLVNTRQFRFVDLKLAGAEELRHYYSDTAPISAVKFKMPRRVDLPPMPGVKRSMIGVVSARELVDRVLLDEHGSRRPHLFDDNLRDFLGTVRNTVNREIQETLEDAAGRHRFAVLNNGITIVARAVVEVQDRVLVRGPQVVNGCQTCNVLIANRAALSDDVWVNVRIIESSDEDVIDSIVRATNRQTALNENDLTARHPFQKHVEAYFATRPDGREIYFERRLAQHGSSKPAARVINRRHLIQAYAAMWLGAPHRVTRFRRLVQDHRAELFQVRQDPLLYYLSAVAHLQINRLFGRGLPAPYRPARFHLVHALKLISFGSGKPPGDEQTLTRASVPLLDVLWDLDRLRGIVSQLLPVIDAAAVPDGGLSALGTAAGTNEFTERFQRAVLELARTNVRTNSQVAA